MSTAIIAALPREVGEVVRGLKPDPALLRRKIHLYRRGDAVIVAAGMGRERATLALASALEALHVDSIVSVGLAGSCSPEILPGTVLRARTVIDAQTGERFATNDVEAVSVLVSTNEIASVIEKKRLRQSYSAAMVDMEAATIGRLAKAHGIQFRALKGVSDAYDFEIAHLAKFSNAQGQFLTARFAAYTALHPRTWPAAMALGRHSSHALSELARAVSALFNEC